MDQFHRRNVQINVEARRRAAMAQNFNRAFVADDDDEDEIQMERVRHLTPPRNNRQSENLNPLLDPRLMQDSFV